MAVETVENRAFLRQFLVSIEKIRSRGPLPKKQAPKESVLGRNIAALQKPFKSGVQLSSLPNNEKQVLEEFLTTILLQLDLGQSIEDTPGIIYSPAQGLEPNHNSFFIPIYLYPGSGEIRISLADSTLAYIFDHIKQPQLSIRVTTPERKIDISALEQALLRIDLNALQSLAPKSDLNKPLSNGEFPLYQAYKGVVA